MTVKVVLVGQTPPPYHGQAIMIARLVDARFRHLDVHHVRMNFSASMSEIGQVRWTKIVELARITAAIVRARFTHGGDLLYYPPAGPNRAPVARDVVILLATRWLFRRTIFHFHAGGVSEFVAGLNAPLRWLARRAYGHASMAVILSERNPADGMALGAVRNAVVPYGIPDESRPGHRGREPERDTATPAILFVGAIRESKGVMVLLEACADLASQGVAFRCEIVGEYASDEFQDTCLDFVARHELGNQVVFTGGANRDELALRYSRADIFCFPTYYESETFGIVCLEAMQFGLPVVATQWRGVADAVVESETGLLVPPRDVPALVLALLRLLRDPELRRTMGRAGRSRFEALYTVDHWLETMENVMIDAAR